MPAPQFSVNASRRDGPGRAEIHLTETDIFYVLDGSAALVTGGELIDPSPLSAGEVRGSGIRGGTDLHVVKGDVVTIPHGVPHWFRDVRKPFRYFVVKSTTGL